VRPSASGSSSGCAGFAGQIPVVGGAAVVAPAAPLAAGRLIGTGRSGTTARTRGSAANRSRSAGLSVAANPLMMLNCRRLVAPARRTWSTSGAWSAWARARRRPMSAAVAGTLSY
jgi:hypothetical protein